MRDIGAEPFAQRFVPGPTFLAGGLFDKGRALRIYCGRKTVQFPSGTGPAAELVSVREPGLLDAALRVFEAAQVTGLASADFVRAPDGTWQFLEMNPRPWGSISAAADAGVELFRPLAAIWKGEAVAPDLRFAEGVRSSVLPLAFLTAAAPRALWPALRGAGRGTIEPRLALHIAHRLTRVARHW
jgi:predicted ATP-grasp superfamily ATP-dependent carboligase